MVTPGTPVRADQRFTKDRPCPICRGHQGLPRGQGRRCAGFLSADGQYAHCSREEHAGHLAADAAGTFAHRLMGDCRCGVRHDSFPPSPSPGDRRDTGRVSQVYEYHSADGSALFQVVRLDPKGFLQRRRNGNGGWTWDLKGVTPVLYRLPELLNADPAEPVYIPEGKKDVDALRALGFIATTNPMGAGKWRSEYSEALRDRIVVPLRDYDAPGETHAQAVAESLHGVAASIRVVELPDLPEHGDVSDWLAVGGTAEALRALVAATPEWQPAVAGPVAAIPGGTWILDAPTEVPALWGEGDRILHAQGETLILVGPDGVGKTTLGQQYVLARVGLRDSLLGLPVQPAKGRVLYIAADRPQQAARSMRRMVSEKDRALLNERLVIHEGPLPFLLTDEPAALAAFVQEQGCTDVVIDALKDVALDLTDDATGTRVNLAFQTCLQAGIEVAAMHHERKAGSQNKRPNKLADVYGSRWIVAGAGSVVMLWGEAGDPVVELLHLKQPVADVGPLKILHDHETGTSTVYESTDLFALLRATSNGLTATDAARLLFDSQGPSPSQVEKARRQLRGLGRRDLAHEREGQKGGRDGGASTRWFAISRTQVSESSDHATDHGDHEPLRQPATTGDHESQQLQMGGAITRPITAITLR